MCSLMQINKSRMSTEKHTSFPSIVANGTECEYDCCDQELWPEDLAMMHKLSRGYISDTEFLEFVTLEFACSAESKQEPDHKKYKHFELQNFGAEEFRQFFRFTKGDVQLLCDKLAIPPIMESVTRHKWSGLERLCLVLRHLAYPNRLCDLIPLFGRSLTDLSIVFNEMLQFIHT